MSGERMTMTSRVAGTVAGVVLALLLLGVAGCKSKPPPPKPPPKTVITVSAGAAVNPDANGRPSPIVVRLYRLNSDVAFKGADFFPLFDDDKRVLAAELVARDEYELAPGESKSQELVLPPEVRFVGVVAAFRDIRNSSWRAIVALPPPPPPPKKKGNPKPTLVQISVDKQIASIAIGP
jgi:type VI secretion system protein VasD